MTLTFRSAQRWLASWDPAAAPASEHAPLLEALAISPEPPRLLSAEPIEGEHIRPRTVPQPGSEEGFRAFLDGTQQSRVIGYLGGLPLVFGSVAAVVRIRVDRRLHTWSAGPRVERRLYAPLSLLGDGLAAHCEAQGFTVVDTAAPAENGTPPSRHPLALLDRAVHLVQQHRELLEQQLAERWCELEGEPIFVDGGIDKSEVVARSACAVGVVKTHRTLYVDADALDRVLRLEVGERSTAFRNPAGRRTPVASWYLRLRDARGRDPLWGLVRVEASERVGVDEEAEAFTARADRISRWILSEVTPLALPDGRWDRMVYGIRDCEEYLRAVT